MHPVKLVKNLPNMGINPGIVFLDFKSKNNLVFRDCLINYSFEIGRSKRNNYTEKLCEENCSFKFLTNLCVLVLLVDAQGES